MGIVLILLVILPGRHGRQCDVRSGHRDGAAGAWNTCNRCADAAAAKLGRTEPLQVP
ncbi:hypothetical protein GGR77_001063 [Xanthomonas translucens]